MTPRRWLASWVVVAACGGPAEQPEPALVQFERRMCACADAECANRVIADMAAWSKRVPAGAHPEPRAMAMIMERYNACLMRATGREVTGESAPGPSAPAP
jgi:hypothetical protein